MCPPRNEHDGPDTTPDTDAETSAVRILALGISHRTAPVELRERLALREDAVRAHLRYLCDSVCDEALIVSTCNRFELYVVARKGVVSRVRAWLDSLYDGAAGDIRPHLRLYEHADAVAHLFRVAASLDSLVLGEPQILGQVREAIRIAGEAGTLGRTLRQLTRHALQAAKRVRTETAIGRCRVGVGNAGVELARRVFGSLEGRRALLVGVGKMGRQVAQALLGGGLDGLLVANRTLSHAKTLASELECRAILPLAEIGATLEHVDIVITATSAHRPLIGVREVRWALKRRHHRPLILIDLAVPRNIDPAVGELDDAFLFDVDDLVRVVDDGRAARDEACTHALGIVDEEAACFLLDLREREIGAAIARLTQWADGLRRGEIARRQRMADLDPALEALLEALSRSLTRKLLDGPIRAIREAARSGDEARLDLLLAQWRGLD